MLSNSQFDDIIAHAVERSYGEEDAMEFGRELASRQDIQEYLISEGVKPEDFDYYLSQLIFDLWQDSFENDADFRWYHE